MKKALLILMVLFAFVSLSGVAGAVSFNGHDYQVVILEDSSWNTATANMQTNLGSDYHLATITTAGEQDFIQTTLLSNYSGEFWLGGYQSDPNAGPNESWTWATGETWDYTNWKTGEPNDYGGGEMYLAMWSSFDWQWNDEGHFGNITGYIAETAPVPEPGTLLLLGSGLAGLAFYRRKKMK